MNKFRIILALTSIFALFFGISGCGDSQKEAPPTSLEVVATSTMVADMVRTIAGSDLDVVGLMGAGVDPHSYEPPAMAYSYLRHASAIFYNGLHLEGKMTGALQKQGARAIAITDHLPADRLIAPEVIDEEYGDPHVWGDASLWKLAVPAIVAKLSELKPENKADFESRGTAYQKEIEELHEWAKKRIAEVPAENRFLITSHDAFNYFGKAYGIEVIGVVGISTVDEPSLADITNTADMIKAKGVKAIFPESSVNADVIHSISNDAGVEVGETLFSDSCGGLGDMETKNGETYDLGTYIGMMKHNINAIVDALK